MDSSELVQLEREIEAEARAEGLKKFQSCLQELSDSMPVTGSDGNPLLKRRKIGMKITTTMGTANISVICGICRKTRQYETPFRLHYFRGERGALTPGLEQRVVAMSCETGSYEKASVMCAKWGCKISDDKIMDTIGNVAKACDEAQLPKLCDNAAGKDDVLMIMMDGWFARHREEKWGVESAPMEERVAWREIKSAVIYKLSHAMMTSGKRATLISKHVVAMPARTDPVEFGKKVHEEAVRMGMLRAKKVYMLMDGGVYLWGIYDDRFKNIATAGLDYYHATEHLTALAEAIFTPEEFNIRQEWLKRMCRNLKTWGPNTLMREIAKYKEEKKENPEQIKKIDVQAEYFKKHKDHMEYRKARKEGVPIGSGSVESLCAQLQNRFKRRGQFWSHQGLKSFLTVYTRYMNNELEYCYSKVG